MPRYDYRCRTCQSRFTLQRPVSERDHPTECPNCGGRDCERVLTTFVAFTGSEARTCSAPT